MSYYLSEKSLSKLQGVHPDLVAVVKRAIEITEQDFLVLEGVRSVDRQRVLYNSGKSQTMNSRHLTGHAVDLAPWPVSWDWKKFYPIADAMRKAAQQVDVPLRWGGNWKVHDLRKWHGTAKLLAKKYKGGFPDGVHFELSRKYYD